jgi:hypothetical protein
MIDISSLNSLDSFQFVPVGENKAPTINGWQNTKAKHSFAGAYGVGLVCGKISGNVEVIDIDLAHDKTGQIYNDYKKLIQEMDPALLRKLVVQKSKSGGYHFFYRCSVIQGNRKLANEAKDEKGLAPSLIETRGEGGQVVIAPTPGYEFVYKSLAEIQEITPDEREILFSCAIALNRQVEIVAPTKKVQKEVAQEGEKPWEDFDKRGDWQGLLEAHGWKYVCTRGSKIHFLRPGETSAKWSGDFHTEKNFFSVFTTSTQFVPQRGYSPSAIYAMLECGGDFAEAGRKLLKMGFGKLPEKQPETPKQPLIQVVERPKIALLPEEEIAADWNEVENYLNQVRTNTLKMGMNTGLKSLDRYWVLKESHFVIVNGFDNVGKSTFMWYIAMVSAIFHGWRWVILTMENNTGPVVQKLCEFYWSRPYQTMSDQQVEQAKKFIRENFFFLKIEFGWKYMEVLEAFNRLKTKYGYNAGLIDPYRSLVTDPDSKNEYAYHSRAGNDFKRFSQSEKMGIYVNIHATSGAARTYNKETNSQRPPSKADVEYGGAWTGPVDDFLTVHRNLGHTELKNVTNVYTRKIKNRETGGDWTSDESPVNIRMPHGVTYVDDDGWNPIEQWHLNGYHPGSFQREKFEPPRLTGLSPISRTMERALKDFDPNYTIEPKAIENDLTNPDDPPF